MGNTNFQTIHQMGTAISNMVKQATGRDAVQNIDMEHVTVAQNHRYEEVDVSGQVVSFQAGEAGIPFEKMVVQIKPVQDLHGYDSPWPGGGGKNLLNANLFVKTSTTAGNALTVSDETITMSWVNGGVIGNNREGQSISAGTYTISATGTNTDLVYARIDATDGSGRIATAQLNGSKSFTAEKDFYINLYGDYTNYNTAVFKLQLESGSTATAWTPYSNICPITGWTMVNAYQSGQNMEDARVYRFPFPPEAGIVYGGTLDVVTGELTVDRVMKAASEATNWRNFTALNDGSGYYIYSSGFFPVQDSRNISNVYIRKTVSNWENLSFGEYVASTSLVLTVPPEANTLELAKEYVFNTINAYFVYTIATPITYQLTPTEVRTLLGTNNIWADTGDIEVKFTNVKELY